MHSSGMGAEIRNHEEQVEVDLSKKFHRPFGPLEAEAMALDEGVSFAWGVGVRDAIFECNSQIVFNCHGQ